MGASKEVIKWFRAIYNRVCGLIAWKDEILAYSAELRLTRETLTETPDTRSPSSGNPKFLRATHFPGPLWSPDPHSWPVVRAEALDAEELSVCARD